MKLKKLHIQEYKNLVDFTVNFEAENGLSILVGNNGSGKSNLLEAISGIFHDLFISKSKRKIKCNYSLVYDLEGVECKLEQKGGKLRCYGPKRMGIKKFVESMAPNNVVGLYSGEEDRLWTLFYQEYYEAYVRRITSHRRQERMRLIFINKYYWNVALLTLLLSNNETLKPFIENDLGIKEVSIVDLCFDFKHFNDINELLKAFIDKINPEHKAEVSYGLEELKKLVADGDVINDLEIFRCLTQAYMPKYKKIISRIVIKINDDVTIEQLSEGEKKLILVKTVLEILSDEKTLVLMDEPDAHMHEGRKSALVSMMREYPNRQIVIATHSPVIAQLAREDELFMIESIHEKATLLDDEKIGKIKHLTGNAWDVIGQTMMFKSLDPLVIFEGKTDVEYVKRALKLLMQIKPAYKEISVDFLNANGAGNVKSFIDNLKELINPLKKVIVFFDRDDAGMKGAASVAGISKNNEKIVHFQDIELDNLIVSFIPYGDGITSGDFLIEDYFSWDSTLKKIFEELIPENKHPIKNLPNLPARMKAMIEDRLSQFQREEFKGFIPLLDKIQSLAQVS